MEGFSSHFSFKFISASSPSVSVTTKQKYVADSKSGICGGTFIQFLRGTLTYACRFFCCFFLPLYVDFDSLVVWLAALMVTVVVLYVRVDSEHFCSATLYEVTSGHTADNQRYFA